LSCNKKAGENQPFLFVLIDLKCKITHHLMTILEFQRCLKMRTTVVLDEDLLEEAGLLSNVRDRTSLLREALKALIERESAKRLASLGGSEPQLTQIARRQSLA
jgi:hypothetical protein